MQAIPARGIVPLSRQFINAGEAPDIGSDAKVALQQFRGRFYFPENRPGAQ